MIEHTLPSKARLSNEDLSRVLYAVGDAIFDSLKEASATFDVKYNKTIGTHKHVVNNVGYYPTDFKLRDIVAEYLHLPRSIERVHILPKSSAARQELNGFRASTIDGKVLLLSE